MKRKLRLFAALIAVGAVIYWAAEGANRGWTKTSVPRKVPDPVTGIEGVAYDKHFVPGVDFLATALFGAGVLTGASFFFRTKQK